MDYKEWLRKMIYFNEEKLLRVTDDYVNSFAENGIKDDKTLKLAGDMRYWRGRIDALQSVLDKMLTDWMQENVKEVK